MVSSFSIGLLVVLFGATATATSTATTTATATTIATDVSIRCLERERQALLSFKQDLVDEYGHLSSWIIEQDCCKWRGIKCSNRTGHVIMLNLQVTSPIWGFDHNKPLRGKISPSLLELQHLQYLDLSNNDFGWIQIPKFLCSFSELRHLNLSLAKFGGLLPYELGNLTSLIFLDLNYNDMKVTTLSWLTQLACLRYLDLSHIDLSYVTDWVQSVSVNPSLKYMLLHDCQLPSIFPPHTSFSNSTISFVLLDLGDNHLNGSIYPWLLESSSSLVHLDLSYNMFKDMLPNGFGSMSSLKYFDISVNHLEGGIPRFTENRCSLKSLYLQSNNLSVELSELMQNLSECFSLESLQLFRNQLSGSFVDITSFPSLRELDVSHNSLNGSFPKRFEKFSVLTKLNVGWNQIMGTMLDLKAFPLLESLLLGHNKLSGTLNKIKHLPELIYLDVSSNHFSGTLSAADMMNLTKLRHLDLSMNLLELNISFGWVPPFQLDVVQLRSCCKPVSAFPNWLLTQTDYSVLDISGLGSLGNLPQRFWNLPRRLIYLNVSNNGIRGNVPNLLLQYDRPIIDLSENDFDGSIPLIPSNVSALVLSGNKFSGQISMLCEICGTNLLILDLSDNMLSGRIPDCWTKFNELVILKFDNNYLSGQIPKSFGSLVNIQELHLSNNKLFGELPSSLKNCTGLRTLDVRGNSLIGEIPTWIGENLSYLILLSLRSNAFYGGIPFHLCYLSGLQILDLSDNRISGLIPKCFKNLTKMTQVEYSNSEQLISAISLTWGVGDSSGDLLTSAWLVWKGSDRFFKNTLGLVAAMDLSRNELSGEIPSEIAVLQGLKALNLSRNNLTGVIFKQIDQMKQLESLDLSRNMLRGEIPSALSQLNYLSVLDLSNNKLSGKIPKSTQLQSFNASTYMGNLGLCGPPLPHMCPGDEFISSNKNNNTREEMDGPANIWFHVSICLGFISGFWITCGTLLLKQSWRNAYFTFLINAKDNIYVTFAVTVARLRRKFHR